jgi:hypothetical protein
MGIEVKQKNMRNRLIECRRSKYRKKEVKNQQSSVKEING